jgi:hypothetical protein
MIKTMRPQEKANDLVNKYRIILMSEDTDCGNEVLCTSIAKICALIMVNELLTNSTFLLSNGELYFWNEVKKEIEKL